MIRLQESSFATDIDFLAGVAAAPLLRAATYNHGILKGDCAASGLAFLLMNHIIPFFCHPFSDCGTNLCVTSESLW